MSSDNCVEFRNQRLQNSSPNKVGRIQMNGVPSLDRPTIDISDRRPKFYDWRKLYIINNDIWRKRNYMHIILKIDHELLFYFTKLHFILFLKLKLASWIPKLRTKLYNLLKALKKDKGTKFNYVTVTNFRWIPKNSTCFYCDHRRMGCDASQPVKHLFDKCIAVGFFM